MSDQHGLRVRIPPTKRPETVSRRTAGAARQDFVPELLRRLPIDQPRFGKALKTVCGEHLRPKIAVIARGIAAREDMRKGMRKAMPDRRANHRNLVPHCLDYFHRVGAACSQMQ